MPLKIYTGLLGQYGDIAMFTPVIKRIKELFPDTFITFAIAKKYSQMKPLLERNPAISKVFITRYYFDKPGVRIRNWYGKHLPIDWRGDDELEEQAKHDIVFETRPPHKGIEWWNERHVIEQWGHDIGINGLKDLRPQLYPEIPLDKSLSPKTYVVIHATCSNISVNKGRLWPHKNFESLIKKIKHPVVLVGGPNDTYLDGSLDFRGRSVEEMCTIIKNSFLYIGLDTGTTFLASAFDIAIIELYAREGVFENVKNVLNLAPSYHPDFHLVTKETMEDITVDEVYEEYEKVRSQKSEVRSQKF